MNRSQLMAAASLLVLSVVCMGVSLVNFADENDPNAAKQVVGVWLTKGKDAKIEIYERDGKFYGKLIWGKDLTDESKDDENPDESLRDRKLKGLTILKDFEYDGDNQWSDGKIYDPENGNTYDCMMTLSDAKTLKVRGYVGLSLFGRTEVWTRVD